jgi:hypothetical protein
MYVHQTMNPPSYRATLAVCQIELLSLIWQQPEKYSFKSLAKDLTIFGNLGKTSLQHVNICARLAVGIVVSRQVGE